jgi:hypothetical protein
MGMLSSLTSSFSRSNIHVPSSRHVSGASTQVGDPTISISESSPPAPTFTTSLLQVHTAQLHGYWCGRYQSLFDRFQTENFNQIASDPDVLEGYIASPAPIPVPSPSLSNLTTISKDDKYFVYRDRRGKVIIEPSHEYKSDYLGKSIDDIVAHMQKEDKERARKALSHLEMLCVTEEAKKSLWDWQVAQARTTGKEHFLPECGVMFDAPKKVAGWAGRMGRAMSGGVPKS